MLHTDDVTSRAEKNNIFIVPEVPVHHPQDSVVELKLCFLKIVFLKESLLLASQG